MEDKVCFDITFDWASLMVQMVKNLPAMQETRVWSLGQEDALEKEMASTLVFLPGESHGQRSLAGYSPWCRRSDMAEWLTLFTDSTVAWDREPWHPNSSILSCRVFCSIMFESWKCDISRGWLFRVQWPPSMWAKIWVQSPGLYTRLCNVSSAGNL